MNILCHMLLRVTIADCNQHDRSCTFYGTVKTCYAFPLKPQIVPKFAPNMPEMIFIRYATRRLTTNNIHFGYRLFKSRTEAVELYDSKIQTHSEGSRSHF